MCGCLPCAGVDVCGSDPCGCRVMWINVNECGVKSSVTRSYIFFAINIFPTFGVTYGKVEGVDKRVDT